MLFYLIFFRKEGGLLEEEDIMHEKTTKKLVHTLATEST